MSKLHELLAVEQTRSKAAELLLAETQAKFGKPHFFTGELKTLKMLNESPENTAIEAAAREEKPLPTTVVETLEYALESWSKAEDVRFQINATNQSAKAELLFRGEVVATDVPVDELMGLEARLTGMRNVFAAMPTLDASKKWVNLDSGKAGAWETQNVEQTSKTEKKFEPLILAAATDKHPAQVKEAYRDAVVGTFSRITQSGAATSKQKADVLSTVDELIAETRQARMRANSTEAVKDKIGGKIVSLLLKAFSV